MGLPCVRGKALALALLQGINLSHGCFDYTCAGVTVCNDEGGCGAPADCTADDIRLLSTGVIKIVGKGCRVTLEQIRLALPEAVTKEGTEYTLNNKLTLRKGSILEIHGESSASSPDAAVSLLKLKSDETSSTRIVAWDGKISIKDTAITSWDASIDGPDERLAGRAYIAALSGENSAGTKSWSSRMDVEDSEISYLGNEGDYHNDIENDFGLVWKVEGYDDSNPDDSDLGLFDRVGVYGNLKRSNVHHNYMGAYCYGMKGNAVWSDNEVHNNEVVGINPQDNSDGMTIDSNHIHDNGWHGLEFSKRCQGGLVTNNLVEDNARVGIFFHRSTDNAVAHGNTCRRNLEGDFGIMESMGAKIYDNVMEGGRYGIRLSLGAAENEIYDNVISEPTDYGVFFFQGSDEPQASADWGGRPRDNIIRDNEISNPGEGQGVAIKESDNDSIVDNIFVGIDRIRFVDSTETLVSGNILPDGVRFDLQDGATLAAGSQDDTA